MTSVFYQKKKKKVLSPKKKLTTEFKWDCTKSWTLSLTKRKAKDYYYDHDYHFKKGN